MSDSSSPFQRVKDNPMDRSVGIQMSTAWISVGTPTIRPSTRRSEPVRRRTRPERARGASAEAELATGTGAVVCVMGSRGRVQGLGLCLQVLQVDLAVLQD